MADALVTVAIVPRERFSFAQRSLDSILARTRRPFELLYVDGCSPPPVRDYVKQKAAQHQFRLIRAEHYLSPNAARNLAAAQVRTKYVVFIDNDALVSPDWLAPLVDCAESTGAWLVGPIYCEDEPIATRVHMAGGSAGFTVENGRRTFHEAHCNYGKSLAELRPMLRRGPTEQIEFHCALVRMEAFDRLGPLDEGLLSACEHTDLCLLAREAGGEVFLEPSSVVTYVPPPPLASSDLPYFRLRWSDAWNTASVERFREKWNLAADDPSMLSLAQWLPKHRGLALEPIRKVLKTFGRRPARWLEKRVVAPLEAVINRVQFPAARFARPLAPVACDSTSVIIPVVK
jgi:GT2 family glycosyltransferase